MSLIAQVCHLCAEIAQQLGSDLMRFLFFFLLRQTWMTSQVSLARDTSNDI